jgi:hypothetical protein
MGSGYMVRDEKDQLRASLVVKRNFPLLFIQAYHVPCNHYPKKESYIVHSLLAFIKRLTSMGLQSLHHRFLDWTKPSTTSLIFGTVADLARSTSELVAENALLRKPLIILSRQVKRPACTKTDRMFLVLLARMVRTWKQALFIVQPETRLAVASSGMRDCSGSTHPERLHPNQKYP